MWHRPVHTAAQPSGLSPDLQATGPGFDPRVTTILVATRWPSSTSSIFREEEVELSSDWLQTRAWSAQWRGDHQDKKEQCHQHKKKKEHSHYQHYLLFLLFVLGSAKKSARIFVFILFHPKNTNQYLSEPCAYTSWHCAAYFRPFLNLMVMGFSLRGLLPLFPAFVSSHGSSNAKLECLTATAGPGQLPRTTVYLNRGWKHLLHPLLRKNWDAFRSSLWFLVFQLDLIHCCNHSSRSH